MVGRSVELVREAYDAWNRADLEWILGLTSLDYELKTPQMMHGVKATYRGREGMAEYWDVFRSFWDELAVEPAELIPLDDARVLALLEFRGTWRGTETEVIFRYAHLWTFRGGQCVRLQGFTGWEPGLEAVGLDRSYASP